MGTLKPRYLNNLPKAIQLGNVEAGIEPRSVDSKARRKMIAIYREQNHQVGILKNTVTPCVISQIGSPQSLYVEVPTSSTSKCDYIWREAVSRDD